MDMRRKPRPFSSIRKRWQAKKKSLSGKRDDFEYDGSVEWMDLTAK